ncbi:MAG: ribosome silencing factor [Chlamydiae bacterium]|nr:ribosome silencing factor [Chlamydiota bacterium]
MDKIINKIAQVIYDKKGSNITALDVSGYSTICDCILIAEGNVDRHVIAIANAIQDELRAEGFRPHRVEGLSVGDWVVLDYSQIIIHLFMPGLRDIYQLEKLWSFATIYDLKIEVAV